MPSTAPSKIGYMTQWAPHAIDGADAINGKGASAMLCKWSHWPQCILFFAMDGASAIAMSFKQAHSQLEEQGQEDVEE